MTATLAVVTKRIKKEPTAAEEVAAELVAREQGGSLTGPDGLLKQLTKTVIETALNQELTEHLGHDKHAPAGNETGKVRNGTRPKRALTESTGQVEIEVPQDRDGTLSRRSSASGSGSATCLRAVRTDQSLSRRAR